jgi:bacterial/archaeal transporter family-2 protein
MNFARLALWAAAAGALIPVMAVLNARLGRALGEPAHAAVVLFAVGLAFVAIASLVVTGRLPEMSRLAATSPTDFAGGMIVGFYVLSITILAPRMGVGNAILFAVTAQIVTSAAIDNFGFFGASIRPLSLSRLAGLAILIGGLTLAQLSA